MRYFNQHRSVSELSKNEFELMKNQNKNADRIIERIRWIKRSLAELSYYGFNVKYIRNFEDSFHLKDYPEILTLETGDPMAVDCSKLCSDGSFMLVWDFWRDKVVQHLLDKPEGIITHDK